MDDEAREHVEAPHVHHSASGAMVNPAPARELEVRSVLAPSCVSQAAKVQPLPGLDERLARELVQGLVQSAIARGADPAGRLQEFRILQEAAIAMSQNPAVAETAERLVRAIDLALLGLAAVKT